MSKPPLAGVPPPVLPVRRRNLAFAVVAIAFVMDLLDVTIVNVALPSIEKTLAADGKHMAWIVAGYGLAFAVLLILGGRLGDLFGHRRMFLVGVASFTLSSLACGLAWTPGALVLARVVQGVCAALMVPQVMALMQWLYAPHERARAFAIFGMLGGLSSALGPILGGVLIDTNVLGLGWRAVFLINLPVGLFALLAGQRLLPRDSQSRTTKLDLMGTGWCVVAALAWTVPLMQGAGAGWDARALALLATAPVWTFLLWRHCRLVRSGGGVPIVEPALLSDIGFRRGLVVALLSTGLVPGYLYALTLSWQLGAGLSATRMSLLCLPIAIGAMLSVSWLGRVAFARLGVRCIHIGLLMEATGVALMTAVVTGRFGTPLAAALSWPALSAQALIGLGLGFIGPPLTAATLRGVPLREAGGASGVVNAVRQLSGAASVALVASLMRVDGKPALPDSIFLAAQPGLWATLVLAMFAAMRLPNQALAEPRPVNAH